MVSFIFHLKIVGDNNDTDGYTTKRPGSTHHSTLLQDSKIKYEK